MKGYQITTGCCLILVGLIAMQAQFAAAVYSMSETCQYYSEGYIGNPDSCQGWGYCSGGVLKGTGNCDNGLLFDTATGMCNYANITQCASKLEATCTLINNPVYVADPEDCSKACYCNVNGTYTCVSCPENQVFNPTLKSCVYSKDYMCPTNSICRLVPNNKFVGDPKKCGNYIQCINGAGTSTPCTNANNWYDPITGWCSNQDICVNAPTEAPAVTAGPGIQTPIADDKTVCASIPPGTTFPRYVQDGKTCFGYFFCVTAAGTGIWGKCPMGTHFSEKDQQCVTPYTVQCTHDRCGNINQVFTSDLGCLSYNYCINQTTQKGMGNTCKNVNKEFQFFDEDAMACVKADPGYEICKATSP